MQEINELTSNFYKYKNVLIELFVNHYGEQHRSEIKSKLEDTYYYFGSSSEEEYKYLQRNKESISEDEINRIKSNYQEYIDLKDTYEKKCNILLFNTIKKYMNLDNFTNNTKNRNQLVHLFTSQFKLFDKSYIDSFTTEYDDILKDPKTDKKKKTLINLYRIRMLETLKELGITEYKIDDEMIREIVKKRQTCKEYLKKYLLVKSTPPKELKTDMENFFGEKIPLDLINITMNHDTSAFIRIKGDLKMIHIVKLELLKWMNCDHSIDTELLHEIIHRIESSDEATGLEINDKNKIFNEVRTQLLAEKLKKELHNNNIYIYDKKNQLAEDYECNYSLMNRTLKCFIEDNEQFLNETAITNDESKLLERFGPNWQTFSDQININYSMLKDIKYNNKPITMDDLNKTEKLIGLRDSVLEYSSKEKEVKYVKQK